MALIKSISGIRGVFGQTLNKEIASNYSISFAENQPKGTILLSQDTRPHGIILYNSILESLTKYGFDVLDCGVIPTPTAQFIIKDKESIPYYKISGRILDQTTNSPIPHTNVFISNSSLGDISNHDGIFSISNICFVMNGNFKL